VSQLARPRLRALARIPIGGWRLHVRAVALLVAVVLAYNYSLSTLIRGISLQTPLAYLALVPLIALALAWIRLGREPVPLPIHDRQVDYIIGTSLLVVACAIALLAPATLSTTFWLNRYDLLGLPFFVAGLVAVLYGVRRLWALKGPIAFLLLAWPVPYAPLVGDGMRVFADMTVAAITRLSSFIPTASAVPGDDALFLVGQGSRAFVVSIGTACSGVNSLVGFFLVGGALAYAVRGPASRRVAWLAAGLLLIWSLNIVRIEAIFLVGSLLGQAAALDVLHPLAGLIVFNLGVLAMLLSTDKVGLHFIGLKPRVDAVRTPPAVGTVRRSAVLLAAIVLVLGIANVGYARYEAIAGNLGQAKLVPFDIRNTQVAGWTLSYVAHLEQGRQFFGESSTWDRILYSSTPEAALRSSLPVYVDVINTNDPGTLAAYGLKECYQFHGYRIETTASVDLGSGITAQILDYHNPRVGNDWSALWWEWPFATGSGTSFERIVVFMAGGPSGTYAGVQSSAPTSGADRFAATDRFLYSLAQQMVHSQLNRSLASR
jgi:exosortase